MPEFFTYLLAIFLGPLLIFLGGAFCGWLIGATFPATMQDFLSAIGMSALLPWQFGGMLGFVGAFFRTPG